MTIAERFEPFPWAAEMQKVIESVTPADVMALNSDDGQYIDTVVSRKILGRFREAGFVISSRDLNFYCVYSKESIDKGLLVDITLREADDAIVQFYNDAV